MSVFWFKNATLSQCLTKRSRDVASHTAFRGPFGSKRLSTSCVMCLKPRTGVFPVGLWQMEAWVCWIHDYVTQDGLTESLEKQWIFAGKQNDDDPFCTKSGLLWKEVVEILHGNNVCHMMVFVIAHIWPCQGFHDSSFNPTIHWNDVLLSSCFPLLFFFCSICKCKALIDQFYCNSIRRDLVFC